MAQKPIEVILTRQLASSLAMPIFLVDEDGVLVFYNEPAERVLGMRFEETGEMPANEWATLRDPKDAMGWGHSALDHAIAFGALTRTRHLVTFHHDPAHDDEDVDRLTTAAVAATCPSFPVTPGAEGATFDLA